MGKAKSKKALSNDLNQSLYAQLFTPALSKSELRKVQILQGAIKTYATLPVDYVGFEELARASQVSRPLVIHYFPERKDLFELMIRFIRGHMQEVAIKEIQNANEDARSMLQAYVGATFNWLETQPDHMRVWLFYFFACSSDPLLREGHRELTETGKKRIMALLSQGKLEGVFSGKNHESKAKAIQKMISGSLVEAITEHQPQHWKSVRNDCIDYCVLIATS